MLGWLKKKRVYLPLSAVVALALAAGAFAYFTSTGSGTGQASVGSPSNWTVTTGTASGTMYPGAGTTTIPYTVTNASSGHQDLTGTTTSVKQDGSGNITQNGASVSGCLASWFSTANTSPASNDLAGGASETGSVTVSMSDAPTTQNACQGASPDILVSAS
jgi:hypothetical protein